MADDPQQNFDPDTFDLNAPLCRLGADAMARLEVALKRRWRYSPSRLQAARRGLDPAYLAEYESRHARRARLKELYDYNLALRKFGQGEATLPETEDAAIQEGMQEAVERHNRATREILKEAGVSEAELGTYKATQRLAERGAAKDGLEFRQKPKPELAELCGHVLAAFGEALQVAFWTRANTPPKASDFIQCTCRLEAHFACYEALSDLKGRWQQWPVKPATVFLWKTADSALGAAATFAESIRGGAISTARAMTPPYYSGWRGKIEGLRVTPESDLYFAAWHDMAMKELRTRTMPALPAFPIWEMRRDAEVLRTKIDEEWGEATAAEKHAEEAARPKAPLMRSMGTGKRTSFKVKDKWGERTLIVPETEPPWAGNPTGYVLQIEALTGTRLKDGENPCRLMRLYERDYKENRDPAAPVSFADFVARLHSDWIDVVPTGQADTKGAAPTPAKNPPADMEADEAPAPETPLPAAVRKADTVYERIKAGPDRRVTYRELAKAVEKSERVIQDWRKNSRVLKSYPELKTVSPKTACRGAGVSLHKAADAFHKAGFLK